MFRKVDFTAKVKLSLSYPTTIKFGEDHEFTVTWKFGSHCIEKIKGDLEITNVTAVSVMSGCDTNVNFNKSTNSFYSPFLCYGIFTFYITANVEMEEILAFNFQVHLSSAQLKLAFTHHIHISLDQLKLVEVNQYLKKEIVSPMYPDFYFTHYVKKIGSEGKNIEIHIENPYHDFKIQGKEGDYKSLHSDDEDINLELSFIYYPSIPEKRLFVSETKDVQTEVAQDTVAEESRPQSALPTLPDNQFNENWYKIMSNEKYADVFLISTNGTKILSHRCILAEFSPIFAKIIDHALEIPITINVEDFDAESITAALAFLIGKSDSIVGKEENIFKFAVKYRIQTIMKACRSYFENSINPSNVCEYIQIAYSNDFKELKQKCLKLLVEKKKEIDASKFVDLPKNITHFL